MKTVFRFFKWTMAAVAVIVVIVLGSCFVLPDQALDPGVQRLLAKPAAPPADRNGYFLLWGLTASRELDPHEAGQKIVAEHERLFAAGSDFADFKPIRFLGETPVTIQTARKRCEIEIDKCLAYYQITHADFKADLARYALYIERYRSLRGYPQFSERVISLTASSPLPSYGPIMTLSDLVDADIALKVPVPATRKYALDELAAEIDVWRRIMANSDTLITQMVASGILHRKYRLASEIMRIFPAAARQFPDKMSEIATPLPLKEATLVRPLQGEFRFVTYLHQNLDRASRMSADGADFNGRLSNWLLRSGAYKPNASINQAYARLQDNLQLYARPPKEILAGHTALLRAHTGWNVRRAVMALYNPIGASLDNVPEIDPSKYALRLADVVGLSRMVALQRRTIESTGPQGRLPLQKDDDSLVNPYTERPFDWNVANDTISFDGYGGRYLKDGRMVIELRDR